MVILPALYAFKNSESDIFDISSLLSMNYSNIILSVDLKYHKVNFIIELLPSDRTDLSKQHDKCLSNNR